MRAATAIPLTALAVAAAGCGGGASKHYELTDVQSCLAAKNLSVTSTELPGDVSPDGSEGDLYVKVGDTEVALAFGKDSSEATGHAEDAKAAARAALGADADDSVRTKANVTYWVTGTDTSAFDSVEGCLK
jgi:hypothetical protein